MQLELALYPRGSLREAVDSYLRERAEYVAEATMVDYGERSRWLYSAFGEMRRLTDINYDTIRAVEREWGPKGKGLMVCTVRKRIVFLLAVMKLAAARGLIRLDQVPPLPKMASDSRRKERFLTVAEWQQLRMALTPRMRTLVDLAMWTGSHRSDLWSMQRWMLDPEYEWKNDAGEKVWQGRWWRRNTKNKRCVPCQVPMEPELVPIARAILAEPGSRESLIVGRVCAYAKALHAATDRIEMAPVSLMAMRHSLATILLERTESYEYVRLILGHEGHLVASPDLRYHGTGNASTASRHYAHASPDSMMAAVVKRLHISESG